MSEISGCRTESADMTSFPLDKFNRNRIGQLEGYRKVIDELFRSGTGLQVN